MQRVYKLSKKKSSQESLARVEEQAFPNEKELRKVIEEHFEEFFGLELVRHEFDTGDGFCDTLAFDTEAKSFVIIEYKNKSDSGLASQVNRYLNAINAKEYQNTCIVEYQEKVGRQLIRKEINWKKLKVICVAPSFDPRLIDGVNLIGGSKKSRSLTFQHPIFDARLDGVNVANLCQLWQVNRFGEIITVTQVAPPPVNKDPLGKEPSEPQMDEKFHTDELIPSFRPVWSALRKKLLQFKDVDINVLPSYISLSYGKQKKVVCYIHFQKKGLKIEVLRGNEYPNGSRSVGFFTMKDSKDIETRWKGQGGAEGLGYAWSLSDTKYVPDTVRLIRQKYEHIAQSRDEVLLGEMRHVDKLDPSLHPVWFALRKKLSKFAHTDFNAVASYISFRKQKNVVCYIKFQKQSLKIEVIRAVGKPAKNLFTMSNHTSIVCKKSDWTSGEGVKGYLYTWSLSDIKDVDDTIRLVKQKYDHIE